MKINARIVAGAFALLCLLATGTLPAKAAYYDNKTITILIGFGAGGGIDRAAQLLAKHLKHHIPGSPQVIVKSMPGAASMKAHNFLYERGGTDGQTLLLGPWLPVSQLIGAPGIRFKYQDFTVIGGARTPGYTTYARTDVIPGGLKTSTDIVKAKNLRVAGTARDGAFLLYGRFALDLLGVKYQTVYGYRGAAKMRAAVLGNEANFATGSVNGYYSYLKRNMVDTGKVKVLWTLPNIDDDGNYVRNPNIPNVPSFLDVYRQIKGGDPSGPVWDVFNMILQLTASVNQLVLGPPHMNDEASAILIKAYYETEADPDFRREAKKAFGIVPPPVPLKTVDKVVQSMSKVDPALVKRLVAHINSAGQAKGKK